MSNGASHVLVAFDSFAESRRQAAPRVHVLADVLRETLWNEEAYFGPYRDQLMRFELIARWCCEMSQEISSEDEEYVIGVLWAAVMEREAA